MSKKLICSACGHIGSSKTAVKGNLLIEIILWLCFLIPGLIYSLWRSSSRYKTCRNCGSSSLIPLDSPMGKKLLADQGKTLEQALSEKESPRVYTRSQKLIFILAIITAIAFVSFVANGI
ncbi:MAG TPA: YqaE/Pmp3 family membrane protein [Candidatus Paceibacterota bacterium]